MSKVKGTSVYNRGRYNSSNSENDEGLDTLLREDNSQESLDFNKIEYKRKK